MNKSKIFLIAAIGTNRALGKNNDLIYKIPEDLKRFRELTLNHPIIMGRKTFESIGRPLPNRTNIIVTRQRQEARGVKIANSLEEAIKEAEKSPGSDEIFIIGGGQIFQQSIGIADRLYLTIVEDSPKADVFFPDYPEFTRVVFKEDHQTGEGLKYQFITLEKPQA